MEIEKEKIDKSKIPQHVAVIMDGNGRWAKRHGKPRIEGHENGVESVRSVVEGAGEIGVKYLTLYAFSTENWNRPKDEVDALMALLAHAIELETQSLNKNNVQLSLIGDIAAMPDEVRNKLLASVDFLKNNTGLNLVLALSYSGRWDIANAVKCMVDDAIKGKITQENIDNKLFEDYLSTAEMPDPELLIRTSGEFRVSNFLLWQIAYAELYFTDKLWPEFRKADLFEAILDYQSRERRFGKTSEQLTN